VLGTRSALDFGFFQILEYLQICNEAYWGWNPILNTNFIYVLHMPYRPNLKVILYI
jgi:hypothetical protein